MLLLLQFLCPLPGFTWQELPPINRCGDPLVLWSVLGVGVGGSSVGERLGGCKKPSLSLVCQTHPLVQLAKPEA